MTDHKTQSEASATTAAKPLDRRELITSLLGAAGVVGLASACGPAPETSLGQSKQALIGSILTCDSLAELRTISPNFTYTTKTVVVTAHTTEGDGGGGVFTWDSTLGTEDNGTTVVPNPNPYNGCWRRIFSGDIDVRWFGAKTDTAPNDTAAADANTAAIQAAIDSAKPNSTVQIRGFKGPRRIRLSGIYTISGPIKLYSGIHLLGDWGTTLKTSSGFTGTCMIQGSSEGVPGEATFCDPFIIEEILFDAPAGSGIWVYKGIQIPNSVTAGIFKNIGFFGPYGLDLASSYAQGCHVNGLQALGEVEQLLHIKGNWNLFERIDKEGSTGHSNEPYILIEGHALGPSDCNTFRCVLIEQATSPNKTAFKADNTYGLTIEDFWTETTQTDGYALRLNTCQGFEIRGRFGIIGTTFGLKVKVSGGSWGHIETFNNNGENAPYLEALEVEPSSSVEIGRVVSRYLARSFPLDRSHSIKANTLIGASVFGTAAAGSVPALRPRNSRPQNLLPNPSWEAGAQGWIAWGGGSFQSLRSPDFLASEVAPGQMMHYKPPAQDFTQQAITIPPQWIGRTMTFSFLGNVVGAGLLSPGVLGCGIDSGCGYSQSQQADGWTLQSFSFQPQTAGTLYVGFWVNAAAPGVTDVYIDECCLAFGDEAHPAGGQFQELMLGTQTVLSATSAPTTGTWKAGTVVFNPAPTAGGFLGWVCVSPGTPGTWKTFGPISA